MKKVLIITYYWPPAGSSGVQRWLKFVKYIRNFGWEPVVFTSKNPEVQSYDNTLIKDIPENLTVIQREVIEPYRLFRFFTGRKSNMGVGFASSEMKQSLVQSLSVWIRGNLFIPDPRILWVKPSVRFLKKYNKENQIDLIVTTGPPHSIHLIGLALKEQLDVKWIADFRDPWTNIDYFEELKLGKRARRKHHFLEKRVVETADAVVVVSKAMVNDFKLCNPQRIEVITNGFDEDDFPTEDITLDKNFTVTHIGSIPPNRNCPNLWKAIRLMTDRNEEFRKKLAIQLVGNVDTTVLNEIDANGLKEYCYLTGYLPHIKSLEIMRSSQVLLLLVNNSPNAEGILTGKLFEYFAAKRPILAIGPKGGELQHLITKTNTGYLAQSSNLDEIISAIEQLWSEYLKGFPNFSSKGTQTFSRKNLTKEMAKLMDDLQIKTGD